MTKEQFAFVNAALNATSALLLMAAYIAIQRQKYRTHGWLMGSALATSTVFLGFYVTSQVLFGDRSTKDMGLEPWLRNSYLIMLASHVLLAVVLLPFIIWTVWLAYKRNWPTHRRVAKPTFWVWLYVSVTGVLIYWMLYHLFPTMAAAGAEG